MKKEISVNFSYGEQLIQANIPEASLIKLLEFPKLNTEIKSVDAILNALENPIGSLKLREIAIGKRNAVVIIPDRTRPLPLSNILLPVLNELILAGIPKEKIKILIGLGTHRSMTSKEISVFVGQNIANHYEVINHAWWDYNQLKDIGYTKNGTPIILNKLVLDADIKIAIGSVKPHRVAGWSGGAKMIQPGVSGNRTTGATHWLAARYPVNEILGKENNPVREEIEEIAKIIGLDFIINCVLNRDHEIIEIFTGSFIEAHRACVAAARPYYTININELADILIVGTSSFASNMWANGSGPNWAEFVLKRGGTVILLAPCPEGISVEHPEVERYGYMPFGKVKDLVDSNLIKDLNAASHIAFGGEKFSSKNIHCILVSDGVNLQQAKRLGLDYAKNPEEAIKKAFMRHGANARVYACSETYSFIIETT